MAKICLLKKIQIKTNPNNTTYNILKYKVVLNCDAISNIIILSATLRPAFCFSSSIFRYHFECFFLEQLTVSQFFKKVRAAAI